MFQLILQWTLVTRRVYSEVHTRIDPIITADTKHMAYARILRLICAVSTVRHTVYWWYDDLHLSQCVDVIHQNLDFLPEFLVWRIRLSEHDYGVPKSCKYIIYRVHYHQMFDKPDGLSCISGT